MNTDSGNEESLVNNTKYKHVPPSQQQRDMTRAQGWKDTNKSNTISSNSGSVS